MSSHAATHFKTSEQVSPLDVLGELEEGLGETPPSLPLLPFVTPAVVQPMAIKATWIAATAAVAYVSLEFMVFKVWDGSNGGHRSRVYVNKWSPALDPGTTTCFTVRPP